MLSIIAICLFVYTFFDYFRKLNHTLPLIELILLISSAQWLLGPVIAYNTPSSHYKYYMYVEEYIYMGYTVPAFFFFTVGCKFLNTKINLDIYYQYIINQTKRLNKNIIYAILLASLIVPYFSFVLPPTFNFVLYLLFNIRYVGALYFIYSPYKNTRWIYIVLVLTLVSSILSGAFHELILWAILVLSFLAHTYKFNAFVKIAIIVLGLTGMIILQSIKSQYRSIIYTDAEVNRIEVFFDLFFDHANTFKELSEESAIDELNVRLNQGWIISAVMYYVPEWEAFAKGETIREAVRASILPRFLSPDKKIAGGVENFERFTGLPLAASMGISVLGEAYANYGKKGGVVFMFFWGLFMSFSLNLFIRYSRKNPTFILWLPLIYLQVVKAETELVVVLNHLVKATIFTFLIIWFFRKMLGWNL